MDLRQGWKGEQVPARLLNRVPAEAASAGISLIGTKSMERTENMRRRDGQLHQRVSSVHFEDTKLYRISGILITLYIFKTTTYL